MIKKLIMTVSAVAVSFGAWADTEMIDGNVWTYDIYGNEAWILDVSTATNAIVIPATLGGNTVAGFEGLDCGGLVSITIPDTVKNLYGGSFWGCSNLISIAVSDTNPSYSSENGLLLSKDHKVLIKGVNGEVSIPDGVTTIEDSAFQECANLKSVTIPSSVKNIGGYAFDSCTSLASITMPDSVENIGWNAFYGCRGINSVTIPHSVTNIERGAFANCDNLTSIVVEYGNPCYRSENDLLLSKDGKTLVQGVNGDVVIPAGVTELSSSAFEGFTGLTSVMIPDTVENICGWAFRNCDSLTLLTIPFSVTNVTGNAFAGCSNIASFVVADGNACYASENRLLLSKDRKTVIRGVKGDVIIPNSVTSIGSEAFNGGCGLTSVIIGNGMTRISNYTFSQNPNLTSVTISDNVKSIDSYAFSGCNSLESFIVSEGNPRFSSENGILLSKDRNKVVCGVNGDVVIPSGVKIIGRESFCGRNGLASLTIPNSVTNIEFEAFMGCSGLTNLLLGSGLTYIGNDAFGGCRGLTSLMIPDNVKSIGGSAFEGCSGLTQVIIPNSVTNIGSGTFQYCSGLKEICIPSSVSSIGRWAFYGCSGLQSITLPNTVKTIGGWAFSECDGLLSVAIPNSVSNIEGGAFSRCQGLVSFVVDDDNPVYSSRNGLLLTKDGGQLICGVNGDVEIPPCVTKIGYEAFYYCKGLTSVTLPDGVTDIESESFCGCDELTKITLPSSLLTIGRYAFGGCKKITQFSIPNSVTNIGECAFSECSRLKSISMPIGVRNIANRTFEFCEDLEYITIPDSVINIGNSAFMGCGSLVSLEIPETVNSIGDWAFGNCVNLIDVTIPASVTFIGRSAFSGCGERMSVLFERRQSPLDISPNAFPDASKVEGVSCEGVFFVGWVGSDGRMVDVHTLTSTVNVLPVWQLELSIENVKFRQRYPWNGLVDIDCDVICGDPNTNLTLIVSATDIGTGKQLIVRNIWLESDVTHTNALEVKSGTHRLVWDAGRDNPNFVGDAVTVEVQALLGTGLYLVIDLSGGKDAASYPISYLGAEPQGGWTDEYKTSKLVLRRIQPGTFMMGSPSGEVGRDSDETQHEVTISQPFYIGVFEVTQKQYELVTGSKPSYFSNSSCYEARPVEQVSWNTIRGNSSTYNWPGSSEVDPSTFMGKIRAKTGITTFDLPTEAVWEYACRAGTTTALNSGKNLTGTSSDANMNEVGRYWYNFPSGSKSYSSSSDLSAGTAKVGSYLPNAWGLYDMHGNVWEWTLDWYQSNLGTSAVADPVGPASGSFRVLRGGSWDYNAQYCRSANRGIYYPSGRYGNYGFRLCCSAGLR